MTTTKDLRRKGPVVTELRRAARKHKVGSMYVGDGELMRNAADMIDRLDKEVAQWANKVMPMADDVMAKITAMINRVAGADIIAKKHGWTWRTNGEYADSGLIELFDADGRMLGWVSKRPQYCDRGHYQVGIEVLNVSDLDGQDAFPRYFMRLETAQQELVEFLAWRLHRERAK